MNFVEHLRSHLEMFYHPGSRFAWFYLIPIYFIGATYYLVIRKKRLTEYSRDALSRSVWFSPSALVDWVMFAISSFAIYDYFTGIHFDGLREVAKGLAFFSFPGLAPNLADYFVIKAVWTILPIAMSDLVFYWYHRCCHNWKPLWIFHMVHHSAKTLNPTTNARFHLIDGLGFIFTAGLGIGLYATLSTFLFGKESIKLLVLGLPFYFPFRAIVVTFYHSHVWIRFPAWLSRIFLSPAMHQIHHSQDPRHHNKNLANEIAFWDWLFGTLYIPQEEEKEKLKVGLDDRDLMGINPGSFWSCYWQPLVNFYRWFRATKLQRPPPL